MRRHVQWNRFFGGLLCGLLSVYGLGAEAACTRQQINLDGVVRGGVVCRPESERSHAPLLLAFHGRGSNGEEMARAVQLHQHWPDAVVVYPDGLVGNPAPHDPEGRLPGWALNPGEMGDRDVRFVDAIIDALLEHDHIDPSHVYAVGHSNGARFVGVLWVMRGEHFRALGFNAAQANELIAKSPARPVAMSMGRTDTVVPFAWQSQSIGLAQTLLRSTPGVDLTQNGVTLERGAGGNDLAVLIHPDGHVWPAGLSKLFVAFFKNH